MRQKNRELKLIFTVLVLVFAAFLAVPVLRLLVKSFWGEQGVTGEFYTAVLTGRNFGQTLMNSFAVSAAAAVAAVLVAFVLAYAVHYTRLPGWVKTALRGAATLPRACKQTMDSVALVTNTIPGMVLGLAFLFCFRGTSLQNTFVLMILCNIVHYFSTPYLMMKNALSKMNAGWETTALLMGDSWPKTIFRVVTPNAAASLIETFSYYFINSMVTISALIFIVGSRTMILTAKIKQLQYINQYNEVFVLSLLILATNLLAKAIFTWLANNREKKATKQTEEKGN